MSTVVTQLIVSAEGAKQGVADFEAMMARARQAAVDGGNATATSFETAMRKWNAAVASTDPVFKAQLKMQQELARQSAITADAVKLGITSQEAAVLQLQRVREQQQGYVDKAREGTTATGLWTNAMGLVERAVVGLGAALAAGKIFEWGKEIFTSTAELENEAKQLHLTTDELQAYRAAFALSGVSIEEGNVAIQRLIKSMGQALEATGAQRSAFASLGITAKDLADPTSGIQKTAERLLVVKDATERARIEVELFGRGGQQIESALERIAKPVDELTEAYRRQGLIIDESVIKKAHEAEDSLIVSWSKIKTSVAPIVADIAGGLGGLVGWLTDMNKWNPDGFIESLLRIVPFTSSLAQFRDAMKAAQLGAPSNDNHLSDGGLGGETGVISGDRGRSDQSLGMGDPEKWKSYLASRNEEVRLITLAAGEQAAEREAIAQSVAKQIEEGAAADKVNHTYAAATGFLTAQELSHARSLGLLTAQQKVADKIKETLAGYLAHMGEEARLAGLSAVEKEKELAVIKGAQIVQKERGVKERDLVQTYEQALGVLDKQNAKLIEQGVSLTKLRALTESLNEENKVLLAGLNAAPGHRDEAMQNARDKITTGGANAADTRAANDQLQRQIDILKQIEDPLSEYEKTVAALNAMLKAGTIVQSQYNAKLGDTGLVKALNGLTGDLADKNPYGRSAELKLEQDTLKIETDRKNKILLIEKSLAAGRIKTEGDAAAQIVEINADAAHKLQELDQHLHDTRLQQASEFFGNLATLSQSSNKTIAAIGKAAAITQATIDGVLAVQAALGRSDLPPPYNFIMAGAVAAASAANIAKIAGFEEGGYTGNGPRNSIAGVVHGQEWVVTAPGTRGNESALAAMNAGAKFDRIMASNDNSRGMASKMQINIRQEPGVAVQVVATSDDHIEFLARRVADKVVTEKTPKLVGASLRDANNPISKGLTRYTTAKRNRV